QRQPLVDGLDRQDTEACLGCRGDHIVAQHQVLDVARWDDHTLPPGEAGDPAGVEEAFDLLVDAADRLDPAELVDRAGNREGLADRCLGERRQKGEKFGGGGAVAIDPAIGLLEDEAGVERKRPGAAETPTEKAAQDQHTLGMQRAAELDFALDVDDLAASEPDSGGNAARVTKRETAEGHHRKPVDLADLFAVGLDADGLATDLLLQAAIDPVAPAELRIDRLL